MTDSKNAASHWASMAQPETRSALDFSRNFPGESAQQSLWERKKHPRKMFRLERTPILYFQQLRRHFN
jgi:hypothetical protein